MLFSILMIIAAVIAFLVALIKTGTDPFDYGTWEPWIMGTFFGLVSSGLAMIAVLGIAVSIHYATIKPVIENRYCDIVSLDNDKYLSGSFTLGSGTIKEEQMYICMEQVASNVYQRTNFACADSLIVEIQDDSRPRVEWNMGVRQSPEWISGIRTKKRDSKYNIYVPKNTIRIKEFNAM